MTLFILGLALAFNLIIIMMKFKRGRTADAFLDGAILVLIGIVFGGSINGLCIGTIASVFISIYLLASPVKFDDD